MAVKGKSHGRRDGKEGKGERDRERKERKERERERGGDGCRCLSSSDVNGGDCCT